MLDGALAVAEVLQERTHVLRLTLSDGRTAILKSPREDDSHPIGFETERASLELLSAMPDPIAPRLLGVDGERRLLLLEELPPGRSLADSLLGDEPDIARADLRAYATALTELARWSIDADLPDTGTSWWLERIGRQRRRFTGTELDEVERELAGGTFRGFVHGDPCPDNVRIVDGRCVMYDFERSSTGSVALDIGYLLAPFPSCWCFGELPPDVTVPSLGGEVWDRALAAALAGYAVARADEEDQKWGTTTMRARQRAWTSHAPAIAEHFPKLGARIAERHERLEREEPGAKAPGYPAFTS
jgi:hypothetical protein